jgi:hypothetical protein
MSGKREGDSLRSKKLQSALNELFADTLEDGTQFVEAFFSRPLMRAFNEGAKGGPSSILLEIVGWSVQSLFMKNPVSTTFQKALFRDNHLLCKS